MKTYVTVEFTYKNTNYLFYGDTRDEVKKKIDNWLKDNNVTHRPYYTYNNYGTLLTDDKDVKEKVKKDTRNNLWYGYDTLENFFFKNGVRFLGWLVTMIVLGIVLYEVRKYMLYPYFLDFVNNRPEDLMDGLTKVMNLGWDVLGVMILFYWKTEILMTVSLIVGYFTPNMVERYFYKKNLKKMMKYTDNLVVL